jgi:hypothetical protein
MRGCEIGGVAVEDDELLVVGVFNGNAGIEQM